MRIRKEINPVNMTDVANRAGVSQSTVSRVIGQHPAISENTRKVVLNSLRELGYKSEFVKLFFEDSPKETWFDLEMCPLPEQVDPFVLDFFSTILQGVKEGTCGTDYRIKTVKTLRGFLLRTEFRDGAETLYDVSKLFDAVPAFRAFENTPGLFEQAKADTGGYGVAWNDELNIDAEELRRNGVPLKRSSALEYRKPAVGCGAGIWRGVAAISDTMEWHLPESWREGVYELQAGVFLPNRQSAPMELGIENPIGNGFYSLGKRRIDVPSRRCGLSVFHQRSGN